MRRDTARDRHIHVPPPAISMSLLHHMLRSSTTLAHLHQIHAQILVHGLICPNPISTLYGRAVFHVLPSPTSDFYSNLLIRAHTRLGTPQKSLLLYLNLLRGGARPTHFTCTFVLNACSALAPAGQGHQVHAHVFRMGFQSDVFVGNALVDMYCKCGFLHCARRVFDEMHEKDVVSWNSIVSGYVRWGEVENAREVFDAMPLRRNVVCWTSMINGYGRRGNLVEMLTLFRGMLLSGDDGVEPNPATMVCLLSACSSLENSELGRWVSVFIDVNAIPLNEILCTTLIDMHSKCGNMEKARKLFSSNSCKNLASWNVIMRGYVRCGLFEDVIGLFHRMQETSLKPDEITMVNVLCACAGIGALEVGREAHLYLGRNGLKENVIVATALVDMYSKCGKYRDACLVFVKTEPKDVALWNAMILGLAYNGMGIESLAIFAQMERSGSKPNGVTFIGVLSACRNSGLVDEGRFQFLNMVHKYGLNPEIEHYTCLVDLLGRAGHLEEAFKLTQHMVVPPDSLIWGILLGACRIHRHLQLADKIGQIIMSSDDPNSGFLILLSNIYASVGRWKDVARLRRLVKDTRIKKPPSWSCIEVSGSVHGFVVEDATHVKSKDINEALKLLIKHLKDEGYIPKFDFTLKNLDGM